LGLTSGEGWEPVVPEYGCRAAAPFGLNFLRDNLTIGPQRDAQRNADKAEFELLSKRVSVLNAHGKPYRDAADYVAHRDAFFGSRSEYLAFAAESDRELTESKRVSRKGKVTTLRSRLDDKFQPDHMQQAAKVFYRWVRKAYKLKLGEEADVPALMFRGVNDDMARALSRVRVRELDASKNFNPRPIKALFPRSTTAGYRLGTISDHGWGLAVDIDSAQNPQIGKVEWAYIEQVVGVSSTTASRERLWELDPEALYRHVRNLSDGFELWYRSKARELIEAQRKAEARAAGKPEPKSFQISDEELYSERVGKSVLGTQHKALSKWTRGFFTLEKDLVLELRSAGLTWGAIFGDTAPIDLMHFELRRTPLPAWPAPSKKK
jgi:hypothetical protein